MPDIATKPTSIKPDQRRFRNTPHHNEGTTNLFLKKNLEQGREKPKIVLSLKISYLRALNKTGEGDVQLSKS